MIEFLWFCFEVASNSLDILLFVFLINRKLQRGWLDWRKDLTFALLTIGLLTYLNHQAFSYTFILVFIFIMYEFYAVAFKEGSLFARVFWPIVANAIYFIGNNTVMAFASNIPGLSIEAFLGKTPVRITLVTFYMLTVAMTFVLITRPKTDPKVTPPWMQRALIALALFSIVFAGIVFDLSPAAMSTPEAAFVLSLSTTGFFLMSLSCFFLFDLIATWTTRAFSLQSQVIRTEEEQKSFAAILATYENIRGLRHDIKQHLQLLSVYAEKGQIQKIKNYLAQLNEDFDPAQQIFISGHPLLDAIVSVKAQLARKLGVNWDHQIFLPEVLPLSETDLCAVLGNLIDNALEAVQKLSEEKRKIRVQGNTHKGMWVITISNSSDGQYLRQTPSLFATTKQGPQHGIGLKRVHSIVEAQDGWIAIDAQEQKFTVTVYLPMGLPTDQLAELSQKSVEIS